MTQTNVNVHHTSKKRQSTFITKSIYVMHLSFMNTFILLYLFCCPLACCSSPSFFLTSKFTYDNDTKYVWCSFSWLFLSMQPLSSTVTPSHTESFPILLSFFNFTVEAPMRNCPNPRTYPSLTHLTFKLPLCNLFRIRVYH